MNKEQKTDVLLQMMEQPEQYTEQQWLDILSDEECRELYTMMALTQGAVDAVKMIKGLTPDPSPKERGVYTIRQGEQPMKGNHAPLLGRGVGGEASFGRGGGGDASLGGEALYRKIAAIFLIAAFLVSLAWAIGVPFLTSHNDEKKQPAQVTSAPLPIGGGREGAPVRFSDVRLDSILTVVAKHYGKAVRYRNEEPRAMKLITTWNPADSLPAFIEHLNMFDYLHLSLEGDTIFVESVEEEVAQ